MNENSKLLVGKNPNSKSVGESPRPQDDVVQQKSARAATLPEHDPKLADGDVPPKKRKTRRGKSKRKAPYQKYGRMARKNSKIAKLRIVKPEAPHNDNQFLLEDHGDLEELDERLKCVDQASISIVTRTRDSSFSVDSDCEFYSSPDDEDEFLMKDFNDQYQSVQTEQLHTMSKQELIDEYLSLDSRFQQLSSQKYRDLEDTIKRLEKELDKHKNEKEALQHENEVLKLKLEKARNGNSDSEDSETDSSDSCSSSSSSSSGSCSSQSVSPLLETLVDYVQTNGHTSPAPASVDPV